MEKCQYLEESKCVGVCINTCKLPTQVFFCISIQPSSYYSELLSVLNKTWIWILWSSSETLEFWYFFQTFFKDYMGVPLLMEPDFKDYSCQVLLAFLSNHTCLTPKLTMLMVNWFLSKLACWVLRMFLCRVNKPSLIPLWVVVFVLVCMCQSWQFKFGVAPPEDDGSVNEPCFETCSIASRRKLNSGECPMA